MGRLSKKAQEKVESHRHYTVGDIGRISKSAPSTISHRDRISFIDSTTHRLIPYFGGRTFVLKEGDTQIPVLVKIKKMARPVDSGNAVLSRRGGRYVLTIPVVSGRSSVFSLPTKIEHLGKEYLLSAVTGSTAGLAGSKRVSLSLYSTK